MPSSKTRPSLLSALSGSLTTRMVRYLASSVLNVVIHFSVLQAALSAWDWPGEWANAVAAMVAAIPAFLISRYWVWEVDGRAELMGEVVPFWIIAIAGLVVSSAMAGAADRMFDNDAAILVASFIGYLIVWAAKFVLLNLVFARSARRNADSVADPDGNPDLVSS